jgi:hypothetical protein
VPIAAFGPYISSRLKDGYEKWAKNLFGGALAADDAH